MTANPLMAPRPSFDPGTTSSRTRSPSRRRPSAWLWLALGYGLVFFMAEFAALDATTGLGRVIARLGFLPLQLGAAVALAQAARRPDFPRRLRTGLRLLAAGFGALGLGTVTAWFTTAAPGVHRYFGIAELGFLLYYPLAGAGVLFLPGLYPGRFRPVRMALDLIVATVAVGVVTWFIVGFRSVGASDPGFDRTLSFAYPLMALWGTMAANYSLVRGRFGPSRRGFHLIAGALALSMAADLVFSMLWSAGYDGFNWSTGTGVLANLGMIWGAWYYWTDAAAPPPGTEPSARSPLVFDPLPILAVIGLAALLFWATNRQIGLPVAPALLILMALMLLLMVREALTARDVAANLARTMAEEQERRFAALVRHSTDVLLVLGPALRVTYATPSADRAFGVAIGGLVGRQFENLVHPEDAAAARQALDRLQLEPGGEVTFSWRGRTEGPLVGFETRASNLLEEPGVEGLVLNSRDATERLRLEAQLIHVQKMDAIGRLAGGVAHDFNNLLTAILGGTELALLDLDEKHPAIRDLHQVRTAASRGAALVGRLLALSRRDVTSPRVVSIPRLAADSVPLIESLLGRRITFEHQIREVAGNAHTDPMDLEHCLLNLAANARDAMPQGGTFTLSCDEVELTQPLESIVLGVPEGTYVRIIARDTGEGIEPGTLNQIFEPFFTTKSSGRGTGLGLASVFMTVQRAGGGISVESERGHGTTITLYFPVVDGDPVPRVPRPAPRAEVRTGAILLVDDDPGVREAATRILETQGHHVFPAADAREAVEIAAREHDAIALLLTDVMMPGESGPRLANRLKSQFPHLQVLFMSGYTGDALSEAGIDPDQVDLLRKPFTVEELHRRVREALDRAT